MTTVKTTPPPVDFHHRTHEQELAFHEHSEHVAPFVGLMVFVQAIVFVWLVLVLWPVATGTVTTTVELVWGVHWTVTAEVALVALVLAVGAVGAVVHEVQSLTYHRGNDDFSANWALWYFLRPFLGAGVAGLLFFVVRGGLLQVDTAPSENINMFGMAALAGLAGLFATPAMTKLSNVFETMLGPAKMTTDEGEQVALSWDVRTADGGLIDSVKLLRDKYPNLTDDELRALPGIDNAPDQLRRELGLAS